MALTEVNFGYEDIAKGRGYGSIKTVSAVTPESALAFVNALAVYCDAKPVTLRVTNKQNLVPAAVDGSEVEYAASLTFENAVTGKNEIVPLIGVKKSSLAMGSDNVPRHVLPAVRDGAKAALATFLGQDAATLTFLRDYIAGRNGRR